MNELAHKNTLIVYMLSPGVACARLVGSSITCGVCCFITPFKGKLLPPYLSQGVHNKLSPIYCQMSCQVIQSGYNVSLTGVPLFRLLLS